MFSLTKHGVLGLNARNLLYVKPFNPKKAVAFADNKLKTKAFLTARGIPAAKIYARVENREQLRTFDFSQLPDECVLKPNYGFGGEGILILRGRNKKGQFLRSGKIPMSNLELVEHMEDILDGKFSLGGRRDTPFFEQILVPHDCFAPFRPVGLPDIRVIVFNLVPVMAMLRIPTAESDGKANLHLGGMGLGIDIAKGVTTHGAQYHHLITQLPHGGSVAGHVIPYWDDILLICSRIQQITNIGYLAVDITIDQQMGPAVLEVNARAGLNVQIANLAPLRARLTRVQGLKVSSPEKGVRLGQDLFGEKLRSVTAAKQPERPVLGLRETISFVGAGNSFEEPARIAPDHESTVVSPGLLSQLVEAGIADSEGKGGYRLKFSLKGRKLQTLVSADDELKGPERVQIGRRDLTDFLIDPSRKANGGNGSSTVKSDLRAVDTLLAQLDKDLLLLKHLKPSNVAEERKRAEQDLLYNPIFEYPELPFDTADVRKRLSDPVKENSPLGILLEKKRQELLLQLDLLEARGNAERFTTVSFALYGRPSADLQHAALAELRRRDACDLPPRDKQLFSAAAVQKRFEKVLGRYGLHDWQVSVREKLVADCTVGGKKIYLREAAKFAPERVEALMKHEIETHVLTAENGSHQPFKLLRRGAAGYLDTQEGLAVYNEQRVYGPHHEKRYNPPRNALGVQYALTHSFAETRAYLHEELGYTPEKALSQTISLKRGLRYTEERGGFTKSLVYYRGLRAIERFVADGGDLRHLYIGKIALEDLELFQKIEGVQKPLLLPDFLREETEN